MTDEDLELALTDLGAHLAWPETPDLAAAVGRRLAGSPVPRPQAVPVDLASRVRARIDDLAARRGRLGRWRPGWRAAAVAAVVLVLAITLAAVPGTREAIADLLGIGGVRITQGGGGSPPPPPTSRPSPAALGEGLGLGEQVSLAEAEARTGRPVLVPDRLGPPDRVWLDQSIPGGAVTLIYRPRAGLPVSGQTGVGLMLTSFPGRVEREVLLKKLVGSGGRVTEVQVGAATGLWLEGAPHYLFYVAPDGTTRDASGRLAGNTLLWERDGLTLRLEAEVDAGTAVAIATSLR
jgi:hypothetical protein